MTEIIDEDEFDGEGKAERDDRRGVARLEAFSDGVFAIAITLLVLNIDVPSPDLSAGALHGELADVVGNAFAYFLGFAVIGIFWVSHHAFFGEVERHGPSLLWSNLLFLSLIAAMPFSTGLIGEYGGDIDAVIIFAANVALASLALTLSEWQAIKGRMLTPGSKIYERPFPRPSNFVNPVVFGLSIPIAFVDPTMAQYFWLAALIANPLLDD